MRLLAVILIVLSATAVEASAKQVALVVGNSQYEKAESLRNPRRDAGAIADRLRDLKFDVIETFDATVFVLNRAIDRFIAASRGADVAVFYFSGHGIQLFDRNVLLATDADTNRAHSIGELGIDLADFVRRLRTVGPIRAALLIDACRSNPFSFDDTVKFMRRISGDRTNSDKNYTRSAVLSRGLAPVAIDKTNSGNTEFLYFFAAQPGNVSFDGEGQNSYLVEGLREALANPERPFFNILQHVSKYVRAVTRGKQVPQLVTDWTGTVVLGRDIKPKVKYLNHASRESDRDLTPTELRFVGESNRALRYLNGDFIVQESQVFSDGVYEADQETRNRADAIGSVNGFAIDYDIDRDGRDEIIAAYVMQTQVVLEFADNGVSVLDRTCLPQKDEISKLEIGLRDINGDRKPEIFLHFETDAYGWGTLCIMEYIGLSGGSELRRRNTFTTWADKSPFRILLYFPRAGAVTIGNDNSIETCAGSNCHTRSAWSFDGRFFTRLLDQSEPPSPTEAQPFEDHADYKRKVAPYKH